MAYGPTATDAILTDRFSHDYQQVRPLLEQIDKPIDHISGDGAYNETPVYTTVIEHSPNADVVLRRVKKQSPFEMQVFISF